MEGWVRETGSCSSNPDGHTPLPQIIAFDELRTDFKNPIDQGNPARAVSDTCAVPRCVRPSVFSSVVGGRRVGVRRARVQRREPIALPLLLCPRPQQTPGASSGLGFLLVGSDCQSLGRCRGDAGEGPSMVTVAMGMVQQLPCRAADAETCSGAPWRPRARRWGSATAPAPPPAPSQPFPSPTA